MDKKLRISENHDAGGARGLMLRQAIRRRVSSCFHAFRHTSACTTVHHSRLLLFVRAVEPFIQEDYDYLGFERSGREHAAMPRIDSSTVTFEDATRVEILPRLGLDIQQQCVHFGSWLQFRRP